MQFDRLAALLTKIESIKESGACGQMTVFIEPKTFGAVFQQCYLPREVPDEVVEAAKVLIKHFGASKIEIRSDTNSNTPSRFFVLRFNT